MSKGHAVLKFLRKIHLYIGIFTTPALLFFAITGALQTFSLHETTQGSNYKPPAWIASLAQLHKKQTTVVPPRRARPAAPEASAPTDASRATAAQSCTSLSNAATTRITQVVQGRGRIGSAEESFADEDFLSSGRPELGDLYPDRNLYVL